MRSKLFSLILTIITVLVLANATLAQSSSSTARRFQQGSSIPATCAEADIFYDNVNNIFYGCTATNTWSAFTAGAGSGTVTNTGTLTANVPIVGNGGVDIKVFTATAGSVYFAGTAGVLSQDNSNLFWNGTTHKLGIGTTSPSAFIDSLHTITADTGSTVFSLRGTTTGNGSGNITDRLVGAHAGAVSLGANNYGTLAALDIDAEANSTGTVTSIESFSSFAYNGASTAVSTLYGLKQFNQSDTGTVTNSYGVFYELDVNGGTVTNSYGVRINNPVKTGGGAVTNNYGLYVETQSAGGTLNYSIFANGGLAHLGGDVETGGHLLFTADNTKDVGASGATRPRTGYFGTSLISPVVNATTKFQLNGTDGITASGTVCTITAITGGIITAATCTP